MDVKFRRLNLKETMSMPVAGSISDRCPQVKLNSLIGLGAKKRTKAQKMFASQVELLGPITLFGVQFCLTMTVMFLTQAFFY